MALLLAAHLGCRFEADFSGTRYRCDEGGGCPLGLQCREGFCESGLVDPARDGSTPEDRSDAAPPEVGPEAGPDTALPETGAEAGTDAELDAPVDAPTALVVVATDPANDSSDVEANATLTLTFSESIQPAEDYGSIALTASVDATGTPFPVTKTIADNVLTVTLGYHLCPGVTFNLLVPLGSVQGASGSRLVADYTLTVTSAGARVNVTARGVTGNGNDEAAALQTAFDYARDNGIGTVVIPAGMTIRVGSVVGIDEGLHVFGNGSSLKVTDSPPFMEDGFVFALDGTHVRNLRLDGNWSPPDPNHGGGARIFSNAIFEHNEVFNVRDCLLYTLSAQHSIIADNYLHDSAACGLTLFGDTGAGTWAENLTIVDNTIGHCDEAGMELSQCRFSTIARNTVNLHGAASDMGIGVRDTGAPTLSVDIVDNHITGDFDPSVLHMVGIGSYSGAAEQLNISRNIVAGVTCGLLVRSGGAQVVGNTVTDSTWVGLWLVRDNINVQGNTLTNNEILVGESEVPDHVYAGNTIAYNTIRNSSVLSTSGPHGIELGNHTSGTFIDHNEIRATQCAVAITKDPGGGGLSSNTVVSNNLLHSDAYPSDPICDQGENTQQVSNQTVP
jgi:parallel beta-helix repeat protein